MTYTTEEKRTLDKILNAFGDYIREQDFFDIVYYCIRLVFKV